MKKIQLLTCLTCFSLGMSSVSFSSVGQFNISSLSLVKSAHASTPLGASQVEAAKNFINSVAHEGIEFLSDQTISQDKRVQSFKNLLSNNFDMRTIARFSMGTYWRRATKEQRAEYLDLFKDNILNIYSSRFSEYNNQKLKVAGARADGKSDVIVTSYLVSEDNAQVQLDWRVRYKKGQFKVIDIIVEGVSMALTQRSDYASVIQRGGGNVEVLLAHLRN